MRRPLTQAVKNILTHIASKTLGGNMIFLTLRSCLQKNLLAFVTVHHNATWPASFRGWRVYVETIVDCGMCTKFIHRVFIVYPQLSPPHPCFHRPSADYFLKIPKTVSSRISFWLPLYSFLTHIMCQIYLKVKNTKAHSLDWVWNKLFRCCYITVDPETPAP